MFSLAASSTPSVFILRVKENYMVTELIYSATMTSREHVDLHVRLEDERSS